MKIVLSKEEKKLLKTLATLTAKRLKTGIALEALAAQANAVREELRKSIGDDAVHLILPEPYGRGLAS